VTAIEKWISNPYALYAQRILKLEKLPDLGREPDAALRGAIVHDTLNRFAVAYPSALPDDIAGALVDMARDSLAELTGSPKVAAFWAPRFARFAAWFAETEPARRETVAEQVAEVVGKTVLDATGGPFTLTARADRIDKIMTGSGLALTITDYKSGANVDKLCSKAKTGLAPQLPLEAAIALEGGFTGLGTPATPPSVRMLRYISASGGEPAGDEAVIDDDVAGLAASARKGLAALVSTFDDADTPYRAVRRPQFKYDFDDYAHLARIAEWSSDVIGEES
jgi:ATP-dependent helicase/nuclease subunit B